MRNYWHSDRSATMSRTFSLLSLILFTSGFIPDDSRALADQIRVDAGLVFQNEDYQKAFESESFEETQRRLFDEDEIPRELVGNWRDNGEALEPKWRDGDTMPLLPFSQYSRFSRDHLDNTDDISDRRRDYRQRNPARIPHSDIYDWVDGRYDYIERDQGYHQRRNNNKGGLYRQSSAFLDKDRDGLKDITSTRYREAFQARPTDYGQVLDDEEYLKPRPRKRRPPQNYEFALAANEASQREKNAENTEMNTRTNARNAVELKNLLKMQQQEGLSLSELLQRRNLTLTDLLGGKADVISALKAKDEEIDEYAEKVERVTTNSFGKIFTTPKPIWTTTLKHELEVVGKIEQPPRISTTTKPPLQSGSDITTKSSVQSESTSSSTKGFTRRNGLKITTTAEPILVTTSEENMSTHKSFSGAIASNASPMSLNLGISQNETNDPKSKNREVKFDGFDEDEIMEFSDFPDYKKGRQGGSPMWIAMQDESMPDLSGNVKENAPRDPVSTLSIEHILSPTELTKSRDSSGERFKEMKTDMAIVNVKKPAWSKFEPLLVQRNMDDKTMEHDYQDDGSVYTTQRNIEDKNGEQEIRVEKGHSTDQPQHKNENAEDNSASGKHKDYEDIVSETESEARAEIFELFASTSTAKRLERLLKSRNMSIDELIALRQRGSSKIHLAEASRLRTQKRNTGTRNNTEAEIEEKSASTSKQSNNATMPTENGEPDESVLHVNKQIEEILKKSSIIDQANAQSVLNSKGPPHQIDNFTETAMNGEFNVSKESEAINRLKQKVPPRMYEIVDLLTTFASLPFAKDIQREFAAANDDEIAKKQSGSNSDSSHSSVNNDAITTPRIQSPDLVESKYIEEIVKQETDGIDGHTVFREIETLTEKETTRIDAKKSRMKPSIIASVAILGVTTIVFLTIFIVCRVRQKQKYRYRNTFSRAVFQGPMMAVRRLSSSSSLSNVMVNVMATSTTKRPDRNGIPDNTLETEPKSDIDSDSLDAADSWETIPDYMK